MKTYSYVGLKYSQGASEQSLLTFCAPAADIKAWAGVPAKTTVFHGGFQRALSKRYHKIVKFFEKGDVSPTSVIVTFRANALKVTSLGYPSGWASVESLSYSPSFAHLLFEMKEYDPDSSDIFELASEVAASLKQRLQGDATSEFDEEKEEEEESLDTDEEEDVEASYEDDDLDIGASKLRTFFDFVNNPDKIQAWLQSENASSAQASKKTASGTPEQNLRALLISLLKPATIIDGQHRVYGAAKAPTTEDIVFSVCALPDAEWIEQVFQFVVVNKLAKPISSDFLTGLLNTSLTNEEIREIEPKLDRAGIRNTDRILMKYINYDERSPFKGFVAEAGEVVGASNDGKLSGKGMIRLAKRWREISRSTSKHSKRELRMFDNCLEAKKQVAKGKEWSNGRWADFFYGFWESIRDKYRPDGLWEKGKGFHLLMIVTMSVLQDYFLETKRAADTKFSDLNDFKNQVATFFADVPPTFFQGWQATGLQSGTGPDDIRSALRMFKDGESLKTVKQESPLFVTRKK